MKSKFESTCVSCKGTIEQGKEIAKNNAGEWVHKHCAEDSEELP